MTTRTARRQIDRSAYCPVREGDLTIELLGTVADEQGRHRFVSHWRGYRIDLGEDGHKAQVFHAVMADVISRWKSRHPGARVQVIRPSS